MKNRTAAFALGLGIAALACAPARYRPTLPMRAGAGDVEIDLRQLSVGSGIEVSFQSRSMVPHSIRQGWLTVATRSPCTGGEEASRIAIDKQVGSALPAGAHEVEVKFEKGAADVGLDLVVDLRLDEGGCVRAPAISQSVPMAAPTRFVLVGSSSLDVTQDLRGLRGVYGVRIGGGGWLGRFLLTAEAGIGQTICNNATCGKNEDGQLRSGLAFPVALDARYSLTPTLSNSVLHTWLLGVGYTFMPMRVPALAGERRFGVHGLHAAPGWGVASLPSGNGPFRYSERTPLLEAVLPVGVLFDPGGPSRKLGFSAGMALRMLLPL